MRKLAIEHCFFLGCGIAWLLAVTMPSAVGDGATNSKAVTLTLLARVSTSDPLSCAGKVKNIQLSTACLSDAGAFQIARLGLAVESLASAMSAASLNGSQDAIQRTIFADVLAFGPEAALTAPAMNLIDAASVIQSPFGTARTAVAGRSIATLEYPYPGIIPQMHLTYGVVATMAGLKVATGPFTFSEYIGRDASRPLTLNDYRVFSAPSSAAPILKKLALQGSSASGYVNTASDFYLSDGLPPIAGRVAPVSRVFGEAAALGAAFGVALNEGAATSVQSVAGFSGAPFRGLACVTCESWLDRTWAAPQPGHFILGVGQSIDGLANVLSTVLDHRLVASTPAQDLDGIDLFGATRLSRLTPVASARTFDPSEMDAGTTAPAGEEQAPGTESQELARGIAKRLVRFSIGTGIAAYYGGRIAEIATLVRGGPLGGAVAVFLSSSQISCDLGEECPGKSPEDLEEERQKLEELDPFLDSATQPNSSTGAPGTPGGMNPPDDNHETPAKKGEGPIRSEVGGEETVDLATAPNPVPGEQTGPWGSGSVNTCLAANSENCGCAINAAGEVGYCVPRQESGALLAAAGDDPEGWFVLNEGLDQDRDLFLIKAGQQARSDVGGVNTEAASQQKPGLEWSPVVQDRGLGDRQLYGLLLGDASGRPSLDHELPEWAHQLLEQMAQPMESGPSTLAPRTEP